MTSNVLEKEKRLSESILWDLQKTAYETYGPQAWTQKGVPFYLTSTPMIARQYASIALGFLRDIMRHKLDLEHPITIFDLGAGSGRFSYLFIKHFKSILSRVFPFPIKFRYIMTDIAQRNIDFWQNHPYMKSYIEEGILDFAVYHHAQTEPLQLINSKETLGEGSLHNPPIILANYYFDTIPQDLFRVEKGQLYEGRVTLKLPQDIKIEPSTPIDPTWIPKLETTFNYHLINNPGSYYGEDKDLSEFLRNYATTISDATFLYPTGPFQTLRYFTKMSPGRFLLICGDQGVASEIQVKEWERPKMATHGTFSFPVDYHAMAQYFRKHGGSGWLTSLPDPVFVVMSAAWGGNAPQYPETEFAFRNTLDALEPKDYWIMVNGIVNKDPPLPLDTLITFLKLGHWDPINAYFFYDAMQKQIPQANEKTKRMLVQVIHNVWEEYYPVSLGEQQFIKNLGTMLQALDKPQDAELFFDRANKLSSLIHG